MGFLEILDLVLQTLEPLHRLVVFVLQKFEIVPQVHLERIVLRTTEEKVIKR
jgi:hypothetical protein